MRIAKFLDIIKSYSGYLRVDNKAGYKETYTIDELGENDFVTKSVVQSGYVQDSNKFYPAETTLPIIMVKGVDFNSVSLRPYVAMVIDKDSTTNTNNGSTPALVDYNYTDATKSVLQSITLLDNGVGYLEKDTWVRVV